MQHVRSNAFAAFYALGIFLVPCTGSLAHDNTSIIESIKTMNHGILKAKDNFGAPIELVWEEVDVTTKRLNEILKEASPLLAQTYASMELEFARQYPEAVETEMFLKPLASYFKDGVELVDWQQLEKILCAQLVQFFSATDFAQYLAPGERQWFVTAKDAKTGQTLGIIQFLVQPQFEQGTVKVAMFGVEQGAHERGIDKLLMSSIFKFMNGGSRIFLHTRVTNESMLNALQALGFTPFTGPLPYWLDMEYICEQSHELQKVAQAFLE